jgi:3-deoxy-manno-octulosonate cytidylyltransferase (CMP-KDO synthetase)
MREVRVLGVIPARLGSERLPRKPLYRLAGRPLIEWVWRRVHSLRYFNEIVIATDSAEIATVAKGFGARAELTSPEHTSGTDRIAELCRRSDFSNYDCIVNVQGDEPFLEREHIASAAALVTGEWSIGTIATPVRTIDAWRNPAVVKVVRRADGGALYFSRSPIPYLRDREPTSAELSGDLLRHIGVYAYTPDALQKWTSLPQHPLEQAERLEQLRPLAAGIEIGVAVVTSGPEGVDTPQDAERAEKRLRAVGAMDLFYVPLMDLQQHIRDELRNNPYLELE